MAKTPAALLSSRKYAQSERGRATRIRYDSSPSGKAARLRAQVTHRARRYAILAIYKHASGCVDCGYRANVVALDFDHRPGEIKCFTISNASGIHASEKRLWAEIAKCDVRCANCHRIVTIERLHNRDETLAELIGAVDGR